MVRSVVDLPARPAAARRAREVRQVAVRPVAGGHVGDKLHRRRSAFRRGNGSDPFLGCPVVGAHGRIRSAAGRIDEPEVAHNAMVVSASRFSRWLQSGLALRRPRREVFAVTPEDDIVSLAPGRTIEDMAVEGARLQNGIRRPV